MILLMTKDVKNSEPLRELRDLEYETFHVSSQKEAINLLINNSAINMLIIDIDSFYNITSVIKKIISVKNIPILYLTSKPEKNLADKLQDSCYGYIYRQIPNYIINSTISIAFNLFNEKTKLRKKEEEYQEIFNNHHNVMMIIDYETGYIVKANKAAENYYGWDLETLKTMKISEINTLNEEEVANNMLLAKSNDKTYFLFKHKLSDNSVRDVEVSSGKITFLGEDMLLSIIKDITQRKENQTKMEYFAFHDSLTGLPNRKVFFERLDQAISRIKENHLKFALFFIDLNSFKNVNDSLGHLVGDQLIIKVAERLKNSTRKGCNVFRLGGDEFAIILQDISNRQDAVNVAQRLIKEMKKPFIFDKKKIFSSASIGISMCPDDGINAKLLLEKSDLAMYKLKKDRKNDYLFYSLDGIES